MRGMGTRKKPTIQELQDILDDPNCGPIEMLPDGSITVDAVITSLRDELERSEEARAKLGAYNLWLRRGLWHVGGAAFVIGGVVMWLLLKWAP